MEVRWKYFEYMNCWKIFNNLKIEEIFNSYSKFNYNNGTFLSYRFNKTFAI